MDGTEFPGGVRAELAELVELLVTETKARGYQFGTPADPSYGCWGYSCRAISGTSSPSNHSWGLAVDINAPANPYTSPLVTDMPNWMPELWNAYGFRWGGDYSGDQDAMHYEYMGSVADAAEHTARARTELGGTLPPDWFADVTKDEMAELLAPMNAAIADCQARLRGSDTGPGQRHAGMDMLQGIDADGMDTRTRVRGPADRAWDQLQDIQSTVDALFATLSNVAGKVGTRVVEPAPPA